MLDNSFTNTKIAKNTLLLYVRMVFLMLISLYTSRVILNTLGVEDYGIYNVVGGVVTMFSMISVSLSSAISRFLTYELGRGSVENLNIVFSSSISIQLLISALIVVLAETLGLWFVNNHLVLPEERLWAANVCFQFSIVTFVVNLLSVPYNAAIIAHEKMSAFAYISILEGSGQLLIAIIVVFNPIDRLVFYGFLLCILTVIIRLVYCVYCKRKFDECHYKAILKMNLLKRMFSFAGWNMIGTCSSILRDQGNSIIINLFFGPLLNSALAIAQKVNTVTSSFTQNFLVALNPQITKSYASGNYNYMVNLAFKGSRISFFLLLMLSMPIFLNAGFILELWLKIVPEYTVVFVQLILLLTLSDSLSHTLLTMVLANGNIRKYMIVVGGLQLLNLPFNILLFHFGADPFAIYVVAILLSQICLFVRLFILNQMMGVDIRLFVITVYLKVIIVTLLSSLVPVVVKYVLSDGWISFFVVSVVSVISVLSFAFFLGCKEEERIFVKSKVHSLLNR